jgi:pimeloyl-ACP methyl ester carboxylesterase
MAEVHSATKSTTGRSTDSRQAWVQAGFRVTSALSPHVAARMAESLFFTPSRRHPRVEEEAVLDRAERFTVSVRGDVVRGFSWGSGPTVLLSHGWSGDAGQLTPFVDPLLAADFRVVALDMPGHGSSGGKRSSLVHFAEAMLRTSALFRPLHGLVAHSFGSPAAIYAISRGLAVERAAFIAPTARFEPFWQRFRDGLGISDAVLREALSHGEAWLEVRLADLAPLELAPQMSIPLLVLHDEDDREVAFEEGALLAERWQGATLRASKGLGHSRILRDAQVVRAVTEFMQAGTAGEVSVPVGNGARALLEV